MTENRNLRAGTYDVFKKGKGSLQFSFLPPVFKHLDDNMTVLDKSGAILIEATPTVSDNEEKRDWDRSVKISVGVNDLGLMINGLKNKVVQQTIGEYNNFVKLIHQYGLADNTRTTSLSISQKTSGGNMFFKVVGKDKNGNDSTVSVSMTENEVANLVILLEFAFPRFLGWDLVQPRFSN